MLNFNKKIIVIITLITIIFNACGMSKKVNKDYNNNIKNFNKFTDFQKNINNYNINNKNINNKNISNNNSYCNSIYSKIIVHKFQIV
ncbi:MAG: hypothetical protein U1E31_02955 [Rickettsiales bacterium]